MASIVSGMIVYNGELLIRSSIESFIDFVDRLVVIDGSPWGPSTDNTVNEIESIGSKKIEVYSGTFKNKTDQRNEYIKHLQKNQGRYTWLLMVDADEVYKKADLMQIENAMTLADPYHTSICVHHIHFWRDFNTLIKGGIWSGPKANILYRINRFWKNTYYYKHNSLGFKDENDSRSMDSGDKRLFTLVNVYHYGHALSLEAEWVRMYYMAKRGDYKGIETTEQVLEFARQAAQNWVKGEGHGEGVREELFHGEHPDQIRKLIDERPGLLTCVLSESDVDEDVKRFEEKYANLT